jgi:glycine C-acetyltransferase
MDETSIALNSTLFSYMAEMAAHAPTLGASNLLMRFGPLTAGWDMLEPLKLDTFAKQIDGPVLTTALARDRKGRVISQGLNLASQDYLSLACHPAIKAAAHEAIDTDGLHSGGSPALMGNTTLSVALERRLCEFLGVNTCALFPTGWGAGYGAIRALVRPTDHIVIDRLSHACLWEGARAATQNIHVFPHLSERGVERCLEGIRAQDPGAGILVVTESLFSMDADTPDLAAHQALCHRYGATLLVDMAHDLGSMGQRGLGALEAQNMVGKVDVLMGSFSKTFAANGGFVACNEPGLKLAIRFQCGPHTFTNAMSPVQAAVVIKALDIIESSEGLQRRERLLSNATYLRQGLQAEGWQVLGQPSAVVPLVLGGIGRSRFLTRFLLEQGMVVNLVEHPAVPMKGSRLRLQVMADHTHVQLDAFTNTLRQCAPMADAELAAINATRSTEETLI